MIYSNEVRFKPQAFEDLFAKYDEAHEGGVGCVRSTQVLQGAADGVCFLWAEREYLGVCGDPSAPISCFCGFSVNAMWVLISKMQGRQRTSFSARRRHHAHGRHSRSV